jgi:NAD(P)-dependent dehydrogenase (short-subunit alcohol dehydrogenase family)
MALGTKIAVITGAGSGIGKAAAKALALDGFVVVLAGRNVERLHQAHGELMALVPGLAHLAVATDVTSPESVQSLFAQVRATYCRLDLLFNNAGVFVPGTSLEDVAVEQWTSMIATNLTGAFLCTREAFRIMKDQYPRGGRIINNGSVSAHAPRPGSAAYTASKHGITGLTKATSLDGRRYGIACGQIDIGNAATEPMERVKQGAMQANGTIAAEPTFDPAEAGRAVAFMASLPLDANVQFMTVMATNMPYIGRG